MSAAGPDAGAGRPDVEFLVEAVGRRLPRPLAFDAGADGTVPADGHPLAAEVRALRAGESASLPWLTGEGYAWFTLAPSHEDLRRAVADLRAWVFPSLGWEDRLRPIVRPGQETGALGARLIAVSPAGYLRWHTTRKGGERVMGRLLQMRRLDGRRPVHRSASRPGLFELRHRFQIALGVGDRAAAEAALKAIDVGQLDGAANTGFMRMRLLTAFGDDAEVVSDPDLPMLLQMRLPTRVRSAVLAAHHRRLLGPLEASGHLADALRLYLDDLDDLLGDQIDAVAAGPPDEDPCVVRLVAYRHVRRGDTAALARMAEAGPADQVLRHLLASLAPTDADGPTEGGPEVEIGDPAAASGPPLPEATDQPGLPVEAAREPAAAADAEARSILGWAGLHDAFRGQRWDQVDAFLSRHQDAAPTSEGGRADAPSTSPEEMADALLEVSTSPDLPSGAAVDERFDRLVQVAVELGAPARPRPEFRAVYAALLALLVERRRGQLVKQDGVLVLVLAGAVLAVGGPGGAGEAVSALRSWWVAMRVRSRLPWLLEALDLLSETAVVDGSPEAEAATSLWVDGVDLIRRDATGVMPGEIAHWRRLGARLGFDAPTLADQLGGADAAGAASAPDPLRDLPARRVAIVTLLERAANAAREELVERTDAEILIVCEHVACAATDTARSADVILFAYGVNTHAVYRAFDGVRDRLEYVTGRGASSIVMALERWASQRQS